jgi:DNA repair protein RecO (recombination protein O)
LIQKTRGIVFRFTKYGETSIIVTIFTELFGLQSYIVNGVRSKTAKNKIALYQPLTLLNLVVYHRENANIERIKEIQCFHPYATLATDVKKSAIALFITELLNKTVKEESHAGELFEFVSTSLITLDEMTASYENFHLLFLLRLSRYLGFGVHNINEVLGGRVTDEAGEKALAVLLTAQYHDVLNIPNQQRRELLDLILKFYTEHMETLGEMRSLQILREVLN